MRRIEFAAGVRRLDFADRPAVDAHGDMIRRLVGRRHLQFRLKRRVGAGGARQQDARTQIVVLVVLDFRLVTGCRQVPVLSQTISQSERLKLTCRGSAAWAVEISRIELSAIGNLIIVVWSLYAINQC